VGSYVFALAVAFILYRLFVFEGARISTASAARFTIAFFAAFIANQVVLVTCIRVAGIEPEIAQIFAMIAYSAIFYLLNRHFVFASS
jgi:putative flippase GtrA